MRDKLIKGSFYVSLANIIFSLGNFIFWIIFGKLLKIGEIGYVTTSFSIAFTLSSLADIGLTYAILRELQIKREALTNAIILGVLFGSIISLLAFFFKDIFPNFEKFTLITFFLSIFFLISNIVSISLIAILKYKEYFVTRIITIASKILLGVFLLSLGSYGIVLALLFSSILGFLLSLYYVRDYLILKIDIQELKELLKIGLSNYPLIISGFFVISFGSTLIAYLTKNPEIAGLFYFALMFLTVLEILPNSFNIVSLPLAVKSSKEITKEGLRLGLGFSLPLILFAIIIGKYLFQIINVDLVKAYPIFQILSLAAISDVFIYNAISRLNAEKRLKELIILGATRLSSLTLLLIVLSKKLVLLALAYAVSSIITSIFAVYFTNLSKLFIKFYMIFIVSYGLMLLHPLLFTVSVPLVFALGIIRKEDMVLILRVFKPYKL